MAQDNGAMTRRMLLREAYRKQQRQKEQQQREMERSAKKDASKTDADVSPESKSTLGDTLAVAAGVPVVLTVATAAGGAAVARHEVKKATKGVQRGLGSWMNKVLQEAGKAPMKEEEIELG